MLGKVFTLAPPHACLRALSEMSRALSVELGDSLCEMSRALSVELGDSLSEMFRALPVELGDSFGRN